MATLLQGIVLQHVHRTALPVDPHRVGAGGAELPEQLTRPDMPPRRATATKHDQLLQSMGTSLALIPVVQRSNLSIRYRMTGMSCSGSPDPPSGSRRTSSRMSSNVGKAVLGT